MSAVARTARRLIGKVMTGTHAAIYRASGGRVAGRMFDSPVLLLRTTGRKSGKERTTPLMYVEDGENLVIIASNGGAPYHPAWYLNLRTNPEALVLVRDRDLRVRAEDAKGEERLRLFARFVEMYSGYENYQRRTEREIPVVILRPVN
jgi:deazaflavin-dependent oxidoreductase (nitroreductase family)